MGNAAVPISRTIREQVTCQIRDEVIAGSLAAGAVLRETDLASRFGISRGPIRDAFLQLSSEGYLAYQPNRGVTVRDAPDQSDREFIAELRRQIEVYFITKELSTLSDESMQGIEAALGELSNACQSGELTAIKRCDLDFHEAILMACGGESLLPAWKQLCSRMVIAYGRLANIDLVLTEHTEVFEHLRSKDVAAVTTALQQNIK